MSKIYYQVVRITSNPNHHLKRRGNNWFVRWTLRCEQERIDVYRSLDTTDVIVARKRRDAFLNCFTA